MPKILDLEVNNTFSNSLPADPKEGTERRQVFGACFSYVAPKKLSQPSLIHVADDVLNLLDIYSEGDDNFLQVMVGNVALTGSKSYAMCYGGHQFGNWAGQLGDGRAINIGEIESSNGRFALQLKGAGVTPYSRGADGLAVLRSSIREYLCSEAMYHLGVPTTRALALSLSGDEVMRDILYNGNPALEKGAIVCRVAESFVRFGNFEIFTSRGDKETLQTLVNYVIANFYSHLGQPSKETYLAFFQEVVDRTKAMILHWQRVGFVHGVMNTDNMSILGLTIDYGPYGWLEDYDPSWTPNTTDAQHRRYRYGNQPSIGLWNLTQLANAIYPLIEEVEPLQDILRSYKNSFQDDYLKMMLSKLGLFSLHKDDSQLMEELQSILEKSEMDMTLFFRNLSYFENIEQFKSFLETSTYLSLELFQNHWNHWCEWLQRYELRLMKESLSMEERIEQMNQINPKYVLRNYMAQLAIDAADKSDYSLIEELYQLLKRPYDEQPNMQKWFAKRPDWAKEKVGCSMLSCSS